MQNNFPRQNDDEHLKAENDFLKMKLMLENGAQFHSVSDGGDIDPKIENDFLTYIAEFERHSVNPVYVKVFEKLGRPTQFRSAHEIPDAEINTAWSELLEFLNENQISLDVCSPNISSRELYRFVTEELFEYEMDDIKIPGMMTGFIYDEFHPDVVYDNSRSAKYDCIDAIFSKNPMEWMYNYFEKDLRLNEYDGLAAHEFRALVNRFKLCWNELLINESSCTKCTVDDKVSIAKGKYAVLADTGSDSQLLTGEWTVHFRYDPECFGWNIAAVDITGVQF